MYSEAYTAFTLPLRAVPAQYRLSKIVRVNATKAVPCRARVSGAVPILTRLLKRAGSKALRYSGPSLIRTTLISTLANPNEDSAH